MAGRKGNGKTPGSGRKQGVPNKITGDMKAEFWRVFNALQADPKTSLDKWAKDNIEKFYIIYGPRLLPKTIEGDLTLKADNATLTDLLKTFKELKSGGA